MQHGLNRLRHDAIVGRDHEHDYIGGLRAPRTHRGECSVTGRIEERYSALIGIDRVSADMLRDSTGLPVCNLGAPYVIEQRCLAMIDMAHDRNDRRP